MMKTRIMVLAALAATVSAGAAHAGTLEKVREAGVLACGVSEGVPGFSNPNSEGRWEGLDADVCRAVAAAVLGDADAVRFVPLSSKQKILAVSSGQVEMTSRTTTWTMKRDGAEGVDFTQVIFFDGQGFMVRAESGITTAKGLDGGTVCVTTGTTTELNMADYFRSHGLSHTPVVFDTNEQASASFDSGRCDAFTTDLSQAYGLRTRMKDPSSVVALPEVISKEPLGPVVRQGDDQWFNIVKWSLNAMLNAEELGVNSGNVDEMKSSTNPNIQRLLGGSTGLAKGLGISEDWGYQIVKQVGNYGEAFDRNVGKDSPLNIDRGINKLWNQGGLQYAPPIR